jgi:RNA polymerase sigma-70 factor (sigma-E family)
MGLSRDDDFTRFVAERAGALRRVAYLLCRDWHGADDLVQASITRLYEQWNRAKEPEAYARAIIVRKFLSERRTSWARRVTLSDDVPEPPAAARLGAGADRDAALDLEAAVHGLPRGQRATLVLRYYCDLSVHQTAQVLGCTPGTVKSQTSKALGSLRLALNHGAPSGDDRSASHDKVFGTCGLEAGNYG